MLPEARTAYSPGPPVDCMRHAGVHAVTVPPAPPAWYVTVVPRATSSPPDPPLALQLAVGVSPWAAVPGDELSTPVALLSTTPAPRPLNGIVPGEVRPVRLLGGPAIVLAPVIEIPPAVLLMVLVAVSVPVTSRPFAETATRPVPFGVSVIPIFVSEPSALSTTGAVVADPESRIWFARPPPNVPRPLPATSPVAAVIVSFTGLPTVRSPTDWSVEFTTVACVLRPIEI